jgi:hypothetical protein
MQCQQAREFFSDYVADELEPALKLSLKGHIAECAACDCEIEALRRLWRQLDNTPIEEGPADLHERIMRRVCAERDNADVAIVTSRASGRVSRFRSRFVAFAAAAASILITCFGVGAMRTQRASLGFPAGLFGSGHSGDAATQLADLRGDWQTREPGGLLTLRMKPSGAEMAGVSAISYRIGVEGYRDVRATGTLNASGETIAAIPFSGRPDEAALHVNVLFTAADGGSHLQSIDVPIPTPGSP